MWKRKHQLTTHDRQTNLQQICDDISSELASRTIPNNVLNRKKSEIRKKIRKKSEKLFFSAKNQKNYFARHCDYAGYLNKVTLKYLWLKRDHYFHYLSYREIKMESCCNVPCTFYLNSISYRLSRPTNLILCHNTKWCNGEARKAYHATKKIFVMRPLNTNGSYIRQWAKNMNFPWSSKSLYKMKLLNCFKENNTFVVHSKFLKRPRGAKWTVQRLN